jgi:lysophospholipase L1-like esterase
VPVEAPDAATAPAEPLEPLAALREAARAVRAGQPGRLLRVAHLGDSHTAADSMTGRLRERLQSELGDGGHGFVVPGWADARLHRGVLLRDGGGWIVERVRYSPEVIAGDRFYGIGTVGVRGNVPGTWAQVTARGSTFDVYYMEGPGGGSFDVQLDDGPSVRVLTEAAERRAAFHQVIAERGRHVLDLRVVGDGEVRLFGVEVEHSGPGAVYSSLGVSGARVSTPLEWDQNVFAAQLRRMQPDLLVTMYGTNDLFAADYSADRYGSALAMLLGRARSAVPSASCLVLAPPDVARTVRGGPPTPVDELPGLVERARAEAERAGCAFWDTLAAMGGPGSILTWAVARPPLAARDRVHLTRTGYERLADALADEVLLPATRP